MDFSFGINEVPLFSQADAGHDSTHSLTQPFSDLLGFLPSTSGKDLRIESLYVSPLSQYKLGWTS